MPWTKVLRVAGQPTSVAKPPLEPTWFASFGVSGPFVTLRGSDDCVLKVMGQHLQCGGEPIASCGDSMTAVSRKLGKPDTIWPDPGYAEELGHLDLETFHDYQLTDHAELSVGYEKEKAVLFSLSIPQLWT